MSNLGALSKWMIAGFKLVRYRQPALLRVYDAITNIDQQLVEEVKS